MAPPLALRSVSLSPGTFRKLFQPGLRPTRSLHPRRDRLQRLPALDPKLSQLGLERAGRALAFARFRAWGQTQFQVNLNWSDPKPADPKPADPKPADSDFETGIEADIRGFAGFSRETRIVSETDVFSGGIFLASGRAA